MCVKNSSYLLFFTLINIISGINLEDIFIIDENNMNFENRAHSLDPDVNRNTHEMIAARYYPAQTHEVRSKGYILTLHRIANQGRPPVYLNHGFMGSSSSYVLTGPGKALGYLLYDAGFDVWLGNIRGNTYSKRHETLDTTSTKFWDFYVHDTATVDLPKIINYILNTTSKSSLDFVGFSMGAMELFIMLSEFNTTDYNTKINKMFALAPVAYLGESGRLLNSMKFYLRLSAWALNLLGRGEYSSVRIFNVLLMNACSGSSNIGVCANAYKFAFSSNFGQVEDSLWPVILSHNPAGSSTKNAEYMGYLMDSGFFRQFDYGTLKNYQIYHQSTPPEYKLSKTKIPVYIYHGTQDIFSDQSNVERLCRELSNCVQKNVASDFTHADFMFGSRAKEIVYDKIIKILKT